MAASRRNLRRNSKVQIHPLRSLDESGMSIKSDEEDDDDEEGDEDERNLQEWKIQAGRDATHVENGTAFTGITPIHIQETNTTTSDIWTGFSERRALPFFNTYYHEAQQMPMNSWTTEMANLEKYEDSFELTNGKSYLCGIEDPVVVDAGSPYKSYGTAPTDMGFSDPMDFSNLARTIALDTSMTSNIPRAEASRLLSSGGTPPTMSSGNSASTTPVTSVSGWDNYSANYRVCVDMTCNGAQMESVLDGLAGLGTCVTMKIDVKEDRAGDPAANLRL
ncbi:hypothetical protein F5Y05DRAFT_39636 [Hypoxylon sp. FL0543]|nr:hypothetical protein F5Y05DRAFT_39636 [Hypoxylon sp. FL0543]